MKIAHQKTKHLGPGGIKCSCCRVFPNKKATRTFLNRVLRHRNKVNIKQEPVEDYVYERGITKYFITME